MAAGEQQRHVRVRCTRQREPDGGEQLRPRAAGRSAACAASSRQGGRTAARANQTGSNIGWKHGIAKGDVAATCPFPVIVIAIGGPRPRLRHRRVKQAGGGVGGDARVPASTSRIAARSLDVRVRADIPRVVALGSTHG